MARKLPRRLTWSPIRDALLAVQDGETVSVALHDGRGPDRPTTLVLSADDAEVLGNKLVSFARIARGE